MHHLDRLIDCSYLVPIYAMNVCLYTTDILALQGTSFLNICGSQFCFSICLDLVEELTKKKKPQAVVNYALYRTLGDLLPLSLATNVR